MKITSCVKMFLVVILILLGTTNILEAQSRMNEQETKGVITWYKCQNVNGYNRFTFHANNDTYKSCTVTFDNIEFIMSDGSISRQNEDKSVEINLYPGEKSYSTPFNIKGNVRKVRYYVSVRFGKFED